MMTWLYSFIFYVIPPASSVDVDIILTFVYITVTFVVPNKSDMIPPK